MLAVGHWATNLHADFRLFNKVLLSLRLVLVDLHFLQHVASESEKPTSTKPLKASKWESVALQKLCQMKSKENFFVHFAAVVVGSLTINQQYSFTSHCYFITNEQQH